MRHIRNILLGVLVVFLSGCYTHFGVIATQPAPYVNYVVQPQPTYDRYDRYNPEYGWYYTYPYRSRYFPFYPYSIYRPGYTHTWNPYYGGWRYDYPGTIWRENSKPTPTPMVRTPRTVVRRTTGSRVRTEAVRPKATPTRTRRTTTTVPRKTTTATPTRTRTRATTPTRTRTTKTTTTTRTRSTGRSTSDRSTETRRRR